MDAATVAEVNRLISEEPSLPGPHGQQGSLGATLEDVDTLSDMLSDANLSALEELQVSLASLSPAPDCVWCGSFPTR